jgi:hypothetical protein
MESKMTAGRRLVISLGVIALAALTVVGCEMSATTVYTTAIPMVDNRPLEGTAQAIALERYATQSAVEVNAIQTHQANATALAANYQATSNAAQATLEQQRLAAAQQAADAAAQAQAAADAIAATAIERAYQATVTQQALDWEATATALYKAEMATATAQAMAIEATATALYKAEMATATAQAMAFEATATRMAWEARTTATAESVQATQAVYQAMATRQAQQQERILAYGRNCGIPAVLLALLGCIVALVVYALRQYARRPIIYQPNNLLDDATIRPELGPGQEDGGETPARLVPLPPTPPAPGLRSVRILRRLDQARRAGFLSGPLLTRLEADWEEDNERENTD